MGVFGGVLVLDAVILERGDVSVRGGNLIYLGKKMNKQIPLEYIPRKTSPPPVSTLRYPEPDVTPKAAKAPGV